MRTLTAVFLLSALAAGCAPKPHYCDDCRPIKELQAKRDKSPEDYEVLKELKKKAMSHVEGNAAFHRAGGETPDLHPDCDCLCHLFVK